MRKNELDEQIGDIAARVSEQPVGDTYVQILDLLTTEKRRLLERVEKEVIGEDTEDTDSWLPSTHNDIINNNLREAQRQSLDQIREEEGV